MSKPSGVGLAEALERAASQLRAEAQGIRPANGDPARLLELLEPDAAARVLRWLLEHEPDDGAELAEAWAEDSEAGAAALLQIHEAGLPKTGRKALRRAQHRLRSRGVAVPESPPGPLIATLPRVEEALDEAMLSPLDPGGARAAYLVTSHPSGGARVFELLLDEGRGVIDCRVYSTSRSKARRFLKASAGAGDLAAVSAPPAAVRALVQRVAAAQSPERGLPRGFSEWRAQVAQAPAGTRTPGELARDALGGQAEPAALARAVELVRDAAIGPWPPEAKALHALAERLGELARGAVIVSGARRREQIDRALGDALPELFAEPFAERTAHRFEETAYVLWQSGRVDDARACLAAAARLREGDPQENPVARALIELVLAPVLRQLEDGIREEEGRSSLIQPGAGGRTP